MNWLKKNGFLLLFLIIAIILFIAGFEYRTLAEKIQEDKQLFAVTRFNPNSFYFDVNGANGFEYALTGKFAEWLDVELKIRPESKHSYVYSDLSLGLAQIGTAALSTPISQDDLIYSRPYMEVTRVLLYRDQAPESLADLRNQPILVQQGSPGETWLDQQEDPGLLKLPLNGTTTEVLTALYEKQADVAIMDSLEFEIDSAFFPDIRVAFDLTDPLPIRWAFSKNKGSSLQLEANRFLDIFEASGNLQQLIERYYATLNQFTYSGVSIFESQIEKHLPKYKKTFTDAAQKFNIDWRLLAAIGYQESHWRSRAVSPTGVRGIMMLTRATSKVVGVTNRLDPVQSIFGGAKFFDRLTRVIPEHIPEPDRTWFALAAYNVGSGHLQDARKLTDDMGFDPDNWLDVMEHLPLLEQKKYYEKLKYGKARGREPVKYVQNIRRYYDLLRWKFPNEGETPEMPAEMRQLPKTIINIPATL